MSHRDTNYDVDCSFLSFLVAGTRPGHAHAMIPQLLRLFLSDMILHREHSVRPATMPSVSFPAHKESAGGAFPTARHFCRVSSSLHLRPVSSNILFRSYSDNDETRYNGQPSSTASRSPSPFCTSRSSFRSHLVSIRAPKITVLLLIAGAADRSCATSSTLRFHPLTCSKDSREVALYTKM